METLSCNICKKVFGSNTSLKDHARRVHVERKHACSQCHRSFKTSGTLHVHTLYIHSTRKPYRCKICPSKFKRKSALQAHISRVHLAKRHEQFFCKYCGKSICVAGKLKYHELHCRFNKNARCFECIFCNKSYRHFRQLENHIRKHTNETPFECNLCDKRFHDYSTLYHHLRRHVGEKPNKCGDCGKEFVNPAEFRRHHQLVHAKIPFDTCIFCSKSFHAKLNLWVHIGTHTKEKWHFCSLCNHESFSHNVNSLHVRRIHTKERPYKCTWEKCSWTFTTKQIFKDHVKSHVRLAQKGKPYHCKHCPTSFMKANTLRKHERLFHDGQHSWPGKRRSDIRSQAGCRPHEDMPTEKHKTVSTDSLRCTFGQSACVSEETVQTEMKMHCANNSSDSDSILVHPRLISDGSNLLTKVNLKNGRLGLPDSSLSCKSRITPDRDISPSDTDIKSGKDTDTADYIRDKNVEDSPANLEKASRNLKILPIDKLMKLNKRLWSFMKDDSNMKSPFQ